MEVVEIAKGHSNKEENAKGRENWSVSDPAPTSIYSRLA
jgi:hypothetical protein